MPHLSFGTPANAYDPVVYDASLVFDDLTWQLVRVKTPGDFYVEEYQPCWYRSADALWFKNLEVSQVFVAAVSGQLHLSNYTAGDPPTSGSPFWVVDLSGRVYRLDADSPSVSGSILLLGIQGTFEVWYKSQTRLNKLRAGNIFARFDEQIIPLTETPLNNPWSSSLSQNSPLVRGLRFTNMEVKAQLQAWSLSYNEQFRIAALLGLTTIAAWDTQTALALTGSSVQVSKVWPFSYRSERPILTDEGLRVSRVLHQPAELWWSNQLIDPSTYTVSNTGIILNSNYLTEAQQQDLWVRYKTVSYESTGLTLVRESMEQRNRYVVETSGVEIDTSTLKIDWVWDMSPENTEGTVIFT